MSRSSLTIGVLAFEAKLERDLMRVKTTDTDGEEESFFLLPATWQSLVDSAALLTLASRRCEADGTEIQRLDKALAEARAQRDKLQEAADREQRHPMAPDKCPVCDWTNGNLMNYGTPRASRWMCHGCASLAIAWIDQLVAGGEVVP
jgi:hypothetical protein